MITWVGLGWGKYEEKVRAMGLAWAQLPADTGACFFRFLFLFFSLALKITRAT